MASQLGVEKEVLSAIALVETGNKVPFRQYIKGEQHSVILYERHFMRRFLIKSKYDKNKLNKLMEEEPKIVYRYVKGYSYGSESVQYKRLLRAREINEDFANMSCSWGKFQVMGEYYHHLYSSTQDMVDAQNYCALQHLQYFNVFLVKEKKMLSLLKSKNWLNIARAYNGIGQQGYDIKMEKAYKKLKAKWE